MKIGVGFTVPQISNLPGQSGAAEAAPYGFKFEVSAGQVGITVLPRVNGLGFTIKWQDETEQTITSAQTDLQSPTTQAGVISINKEGDQTWCDDFAVASGKQFVTKVTSWGQNPWNRLLNAFKDCTNLTEIGTTGLLTDSANGSTFDSLFEGCTSLTAINMTNWDLSSGSGASIRKIAKGCVNLEQVDLPSNKKIKFKALSNEVFRDSGTSTTNGCVFNMQGLDSSTTTSSGGYVNDSWFRGCKISPSSNFSNWVFNSSLTWTMNFMFYLAEMTGTNSTLDISGWSTLKATHFGSFLRGFNSNGATPKPDSNFTINVSNLNLSNATNLSLFFGFATNSGNVKNIIGLSTLPAMVSASTSTSYFIGGCPFLKLTDDDNLSDAFMNSLNSNNGSSMFQDLGQSLTLGDYGKAPNLAGLNLSASTTLASMFRKAKFSNAPDFSNVIFPTAAVSYSTFAYFLEVSDTDAHLVIDRPTFKPSTLQFAFSSILVPKVTIGDSVDLSAVTTFQYLFLSAGSASKPCEVTLPTTADYSGTTLATSWDNMFNGLNGPLGGTQVLSTCVGDTFIRRLHASTLNTNPQSINLFNTKLTGSPSVVRTLEAELVANGWTITENSTDAVMPFVYTAPFQTGNNITPTINTSGGKFSSSNVTINEDTGTFNSSTAVNATIRYTFADGCYNEQVLNVVVPFSPFKFRATGPITIKAQPAVAGSFTIDWGDGSTPTSTPGGTSIASNFTTPGTYDVQINASGDNTYCDEFAIVSGQTNVTKVLDWGEKPWSSMGSAFANCDNLTNISETVFTAAAGCNMRSMLNNCDSLTIAKINNWNLSAGIDAYEGLIRNCDNLEELDATNLVIKFSGASGGRTMFGNNGNSVTNGCLFKMSGMDFSSTTLNLSGGNSTIDMFSGCKFADGSDLSNWNFPATWNGGGFFSSSKIVGTNAVLNISNWDNYPGVSLGFSGMNNLMGDTGAKINLTNLNLSNFNNMQQMFYFTDLSQIIGVSTWNATAGNVNAYRAFWGSNYLSVTPTDNFSNAFIQSLTPTNVTQMFQSFGDSNENVAVNLNGLDLSNVTDFNSFMSGAKFSTAPDFSNVTFPSTAISWAAAFYGFDLPDAATSILDFSNTTAKISSLASTFSGCGVNEIKFGNNVDFSQLTSFNNTFYAPPRFNNPQFSTTANFGAVTDFTRMFYGNGNSRFSTCQTDNFIRRLHATAFSNNGNVPLNSSQITEAPSVVRTLEAELVAGGWTITENTTDATIPFEYTGDLEPDTNITPTNNTGSAFTGTFTSSDPTNIPVVASGTNAGLINTSNGGNATIRYTLPNGCYTEQAIVINLPYKIEVVIPSDDLVFPIYGNSSATADYDFTVDWGDGTSNSYSGSTTGRSISRTYGAAGTYQISIKGNAWPGATWSAFQNKLNRITKLLSWGNTGIRDLAYAFSGSTALVQATPPDVIKFSASGTGQIRNCFYNCVNLTTASIAGTDTSAITSASGVYAREVFSGCTSLETLDVQNITIGDYPGLYTVTTAIYRFAGYVGTNVTDGTEINFSNITFANSVSANEYGVHQFFYSSRIKSSIADNWNFTGHSGNINLSDVLYSAVFPTANKTAYFRNWTFNSNNNIDISGFAGGGQLDEIDFSGNTEIMYINRSYQTLFYSQVQRIKGLDKWKSATTMKTTGLQRIFRNASFLTFLATDSQYNFRNDFIHSGSNADSLYLGFTACGNNAAVSSVNSVPNMGNWGMDNITSLNQCFYVAKFSEYPTLYWNLSNVSNFTYAFYQAHPKGTNYTKDIDFRNCTFAPSTSTINVDMSRAFYQAYFQNIYFSSSEELPRNNVLARTFSGISDTSLESTNLDKWDYGNIGSASEDLYLLQGYNGTLSAAYYADILARIRATAPISVNSQMAFGFSRLNASAIYTTQQGPSSGWNVAGTTVIEETGIGENVSVGDIFYQSNQAQSARYYYRITAVSEDEITIASGLLYTGNYWNILTSQAAKDRQYIVENLAIGFTDGLPIL